MRPPAGKLRQSQALGLSQLVILDLRENVYASGPVIHFDCRFVFRYASWSANFCRPGRFVYTPYCARSSRT